MKTVKIIVEFTIENPNIDIAGSLAAIKRQFEDADKKSIAEVCWSYGDYQDCEVTGVVVTETHDLR
jgi:hypothetical protein